MEDLWVVLEFFVIAVVTVRVPVFDRLSGGLVINKTKPLELSEEGFDRIPLEQGTLAGCLFPAGY
jgi:hypothetical protein